MKTSLIISALALFLVSSPAFAGHDDDYGYGYGEVGYGQGYERGYGDQYGGQYGRDGGYGYEDDRYGGRGGYGYAQVVRVEPIIERGYRQDPYEACNSARGYDRYDRYERYDNRPRVPSVLGGIIGGVVGNRFGNGGGRTVMTVAGAVLGSAIARDAQSYGRDDRYRGRDACDGRYGGGAAPQVLGYDVTYRYAGQLYRTQTEYPPGDSIRVRVDVAPAR